MRLKSLCGTLVGLSISGGAAVASGPVVVSPPPGPGSCPPPYAVPGNVPWSLPAAPSAPSGSAPSATPSAPSSTAPGSQPSAAPGAAQGQTPTAPGQTPFTGDMSADASSNMLAEPGGTGGAGSSIPTMYGDAPYYLSRGYGVFAQIARGAYKITENESPRPLDRVFATYHYYNELVGSSVDLHREVVGFEKTFLDGNASFGMRLPILQTSGGLNQSGIGDLSMIFKYALVNDRCTGNVLSGGLVVTAPTGEDFIPNGGVGPHSTLLQPWTGGILTFGDFYVQGFSSVVFPTDGQDVNYWFNDVGVGYLLYRNNCCDALLTSVTPIGEVHVTTPLNHRGFNATYGGIDIVTLTGGTSFGFGNRSWLNVGANVPVTGTRPYSVEAMIQFNCRF